MARFQAGLVLVVHWLWIPLLILCAWMAWKIFKKKKAQWASATASIAATFSENKVLTEQVSRLSTQISVQASGNTVTIHQARDEALRAGVQPDVYFERRGTRSGLGAGSDHALRAGSDSGPSVWEALEHGSTDERVLINVDDVRVARSGGSFLDRFGHGVRSSFFDQVGDDDRPEDVEGDWSN